MKTASHNISFGNHGVRRLIPKEYGRPKTSNLDVTIDGPTDELKIELTQGGRKPFEEIVSQT